MWRIWEGDNEGADEECNGLKKRMMRLREVAVWWGELRQGFGQRSKAGTRRTAPAGPVSNKGTTRHPDHFRDQGQRRTGIGQAVDRP